MAFADMWQMLGHFRPSAPAYLPKDYADLTGKVFIVTGGPTGVGFQTSRLLVSKNAKVYLAARNAGKIDAAIERITTEFPNAKVGSLVVDLSNLPTIKPGIQKFLDQETRLDGLILNAGVMAPPTGSKTAQDYELQLGTNCVGHWLLAKLLERRLVSTAKQAPANSVRMIWVSSSAHIFAPKSGLDFDEPSKGAPMRLYGQSKAINIQQAMIYGRQLRAAGIVCLSVHPGNLKSELQRYSGDYSRKALDCVLYEPVYGAYSELFATLSPEITTADNGKYVIPWGKFGQIKPEVKQRGNGAEGDKLENWLDQQIASYL